MIQLRRTPNIPMKGLLIIWLLLSSTTMVHTTRGMSLGCGDDWETGGPQATAHIYFDGDQYQNATLNLNIDWGDGNGVRRLYNLSDINGERLEFEHNYENVTDPDNWSFPLSMYAGVTSPEYDEPLVWSTEMTCGATTGPRDSAASPWKGGMSISVLAAISLVWYLLLSTG